MSPRRTLEALLLAVGMVASAWVLGHFLLQFKQAGRTVEVKGLSEREVPADTAIWPIAFSEADNDLTRLYQALQDKNAKIVAFLQAKGFEPKEISISAPSITDRQAQDYGNAQLAERVRYSGKSTVTVYTRQIERVREAMAQLGELGKEGSALSAELYENRSQFLFAGLNAMKPSMIEEATKNARIAADKFAKDSDSRLGKIRHANQGQFSIEDRDASMPHIKKVRVVSSVEYSLVD